MAHQHNQAIQCHSRWFTLENTDDRRQINNTDNTQTIHNPEQESLADADKPTRRKKCKNCSNSTCFVSFHQIPFPQISNYQSSSSSSSKFLKWP